MENDKLIETVKRAKSGDSAAMGELYEQTSKMVYFNALKFTGNEADAQDVTQDVFVTVITKLSELKDEQTFPKWLKTITVNYCKNFCKKKKPMLFSTDEEEEQAIGGIEELSEEFLPEVYADKQEGSRIIMDIIDRLPEKQKIVIIMYYFDEMSVTEIAAELETSENTVKSRLNYARAKIKEEVELIEKTQNIRLHAVPVPMFGLVSELLKLGAESGAVPAGIFAKATAAAGTTATAAATTSAATATASATTVTTSTAAAATTTTAATSTSIGLGAKIAIGVAATAVAAGAGTAAVIVASSGTPAESAGIPAYVDESVIEENILNYISGADETLDTTWFEYVTELRIDSDMNVEVGFPRDDISFTRSCEHSENDAEWEMTDFSFIAKLENLQYLSVFANGVSDFSALSSLKELETLQLFTRDFSELSVLSGLKDLKTLYLCNCGIDDISGLKDMTGLESLCLYANNISDISPLSGMSGLKYLCLHDNELDDISALAGLSSLEELHIDADTPDISALSELTELIELHFTNNEVVDISPIYGLDKLTYISVTGEKISAESIERISEFIPDCYVDS